jgi:protein arginine kinase activator
MECDICHEREATVHLTEVVNENVTKLHLCEKCAKKKSEEMQSHFGLTDLLSGLMDFVPSVPEDNADAVSGLRCDTCGMTYRDFQKTGRLGCGKCYEKFDRNLGELLKKIHGSDRHVGKMPLVGKAGPGEEEDLRRLKSELDGLVRAEEFEKAAVLRDRVRELEEKIRERES